MSAFKVLNEYITIDKDGNITVPDSIKNALSFKEHRVTTIRFEGPRYTNNGVDMSELAIYISCMHSNNSKSPLLPTENVKVASDTNRITFDWTPTREATKIKGKLSFVVCARRTNSENELTNEWHSKMNRDINIPEGIDCVNEVEERYPDAITALFLEIKRLEELISLNTGESILDENGNLLLDEIGNRLIS